METTLTFFCTGTTRREAGEIFSIRKIKDSTMSILRIKDWAKDFLLRLVMLLLKWLLSSQKEEDPHINDTVFQNSPGKIPGLDVAGPSTLYNKKQTKKKISSSFPPLPFTASPKNGFHLCYLQFFFSPSPPTPPPSVHTERLSAKV